MKKLLLLGFMTYATSSYSKDIELTKFYLEGEKLVNGTSRYLPAGYRAKYGTAMGFDIGILRYGYINTRISSQIDQQQYRYVAMDNEFGVKAVENVDIYFRHYSGHALDSKYGYHYPYDNAIGIRFYLKY